MAYHVAMDAVRLAAEPRFFLRIGSGDHVVVDRLLTPTLFDGPARLDGVVRESKHAKRFADARQRLPNGCLVIVEPQSYREQEADHQGSAICPEGFADARFLKAFVHGALEQQAAVEPSFFLSPAFFADSLNSPWQRVNQRLLEETIRQVGADRVYATLCGSHKEFCSPQNTQTIIDIYHKARVRGVYVLISPLASARDGSTKLTNYCRLLLNMEQRGLSTIAGRQPAFGLGLLALGVWGFDGGIAQAEGFDYRAFVRQIRRHSKEEKKNSGRRQRVYFPLLKTALPAEVAREIFETSGLRGSFTCSGQCCEGGQLAVATIRNREHFIYSRLDEVAALRRLPAKWRTEEFGRQLQSARQLADKVMLSLPHAHRKGFAHLDTWQRVMEGLSLEKAA